MANAANYIKREEWDGKQAFMAGLPRFYVFISGAYHCTCETEEQARAILAKVTA